MLGGNGQSLEVSAATFNISKDIHPDKKMARYGEVNTCMRQKLPVLVILPANILAALNI